MNREKFMLEIQRIFRVLFVQKSITMFLRAAWIGGAAYLLCWGTNQLWGWFPDQGSWLFYAGLISVLVLGSVLLKRKPTLGFVWRLDRAFNLRQQVYTAYEILATDTETNAAEDPGMQELLESEAVGRLPSIRHELADRGWQFRREFESTIVVLILLLIVYLSSVGDISRISGGFGTGFLPLLGRDPTASEIFSGGIPGETRETAPSEGAGGDLPVETQAGDLNLDPEEFAEVARVLESLGEKLSGQAASKELGEALRNQNFEQAAGEFGAMAEEIGDYAPETRQSLADRFLETSIEMQNIGQPDIGTDFSEATASLLGNNTASMAEDLDNLSDLMLNLAKIQDQLATANLETNNLPGGQQPLDQTSGQIFGLELLGGEQDFTSLPSEGPATGSGAIGDSVDFIMPFDGSVSEGVWLPYNISLDDSDVVSSYFSPR